MISVDDKTIYISELQKQKYKGHHVLEKSTAYQEAILKRIEDSGFTLDELMNDNYKRLRFNIRDTLSWVNKYNENDKITPIAKVDLGW